MKILGLDSATGGCSAAVVEDERVLARRQMEQDRGQAAVLMPLIEEVLAEARLDYGALDRLAVTVGPGTFTGLRIGLATARGLALATGLPLIGITTFEAFAAAVPAGDLAGRTMLVAVDSRRAELFVQMFGAGLRPLGPPVMAKPEDIVLPEGPLLLAGDAASQLAPFLESRPDVQIRTDIVHPDPALVAQLAAARPVPDRPPAPLYLRDADVTLPGGVKP